MAQRPFRLSAIGWVIAIMLGIGILTAVGMLGPVQRLAVRVLAPIGQVSHKIVEGVRITLGDRQQ